MRNMFKVAGLMIGLAVFGCGGTVDEGPHEFKATDTNTKAFEDMKNQMIGNFKSKAYMKNKPAAPPAGGAAPAEKKD